MEPISAVASIWAVIEATGKVCKVLRDVAKASHDIIDLQKELAILYSLFCFLANLEQRLREPLSDSATSLRALDLKDGPLAEYADALARLQMKVGYGKPKHKIISWYLAKDEVKQILDKIERLKTVIILDLNIDQIQHSMAIRLSLDGINAKQEQSQGHARLREALDWISGLNFRASKASILSQLGSGTVDWFLQAPEIQNWIDKPGQNLVCTGIPGAGKSVLAARICEHLEKRVVSSSSSTSVVYIFCDYKAEAEQSISQLLGAIMQQLIQNNKMLAEPLVSLHESHLEKRSFPSPEEIFAAIKSVTMQQKAIYIIVDALDEYNKTDKQRREFIGFLSRLTSETLNISLLVTSRPTPELPQQLRHIPHMEVRAMAEHIKEYLVNRSSEFVVTLDDKLRNDIAEAVASKTDGMFLLARFLVDRFERLHTKRQIKALIGSLAGGASSDQSPKDLYNDAYQDTMARIERQSAEDRDLARRVLLWVSSTARRLTARELRCALSVEMGDTHFDEDNVCDVDLILKVCAGLVVVDKDSQTISLVHLTAQEFLDDIHRAKKEILHGEIARTCLTYLSFDHFKSRAVTSTLRYHLMAPSQDARLLTEAQVACRDEENLRPQVNEHFKFSDVYARFDNESSDLLHYPDDKDKPMHALNESHDAGSGAAPFNMIPSWSIHYKACTWNSNGVWTNEHSVVSKRSSQVQEIETVHGGTAVPDSLAYGLVDYAANYWAYHARFCEEDVAELALALLCTQDLAAHAFQTATTLYKAWPFLSVPLVGPTRLTGLHLAAACGLEYTCAKLLERVDNADARDDSRRTSLMWAAHHGHAKVVALFLQRADIDVHKTCARGDTAMHYAAREGHTSIVQLFLSRQADSVTSEMPLEKNENFFGETPVVQAALEGHVETTALLRETDSQSIHSEVMFGLWPVHLAAQRRKPAVFKLLVESCKVSLDIKDPKGYSPFTVAVDWGNEEVVRYFFQRQQGWIQKNKDEVIKAAHLAAAHWKRVEVLKMICSEASHLADFRGTSDRTLIESAADAMNMEAVIALSASPHLPSSYDKEKD